MKTIISCLSDCTRGAPLTTTRHYAQLPIANKELILHNVDLIGKETIHVLVKKDDAKLKAFLEERAIPFIERIEDREALFIPGDLFLKTVPDKKGMLVHEEGSEEQDALKPLLGDDITELKSDAIRVNYPWELLNANTAAIRSITKGIHESAIIEAGVTITGEVVIGKGTVVKAGSYLEGPLVIGDECVIGPMAHLRPETSIADGCVIGKTEVYDTVIMDGSVSKHASYLGHSVLGEDVNVGASTVTADYRHDGQEHLVHVKGEKVKSGRRKVGAFIGDHARLAISTSIYPGRKIAANGTTLPGEIVQKDKE